MNFILFLYLWVGVLVRTGCGLLDVRHVAVGAHESKVTPRG
jgi:hypothetical protein